MKLTEKVKVDFKGRITIPLYIREILGLFEGSSVIIEADPDSRTLKITPLEYRGSIYYLEVWLENISSLDKIIPDILSINGVNEILDLKCIKYLKGYKCMFTVSMDPDNVKETINKLSSKYFVKL